MEADNRTEGAEATTLHPGFLHALHLGDAKTNTTTSFEPPGSSPPLNTQPLSRPSDTCSEESEYLPARRGVYAARGTIVHIRRASRKTTFVDIDLVARGSREAGADAAEVAVSREVSECCDSENSTPGNVDFLPLEQPDMGQGHEHGVSADGIKPDCSQDTASFRNSDSRQKRSGLSRLEQATLDQATPEPAIPERATSDCSNCSRLELMIPGSLLASLPQKLRIGSVVECQGESLENLSAAPAGTPQSGSSFRNTDDKSQVQKSTFTNNEDGGFLAEPLQNETEDKLENRRCEISTGEALREDEHVSEKYCSLQEAGFDRVPESRCEESSLVGEGGFDIDWMLRVSSLKVFDPRGSASGNEFLYKHLAAKSELPSICRGGRTVLAKPGVCKYWVNEGRCARGSDCPYEHPPHGEPLKKARAEYLAAKSSGDHALGNAGKAKRAQVFGDWVKETYGAGSAGLQVMDIAAGAHGELAFHLAEHGVFCTSVEPRERKLTKAQRKSLAEKGVRLPRESTPPVLPQNLVGAHRRELFADDEYWADAVRKEANLLVGLHPDQVTEAVVDVALRAGVPFAVVPCCVFPKLFPDRRIEDGRPVITYDDFIEYLQHKGRAHGKVVEKATLKFAGSNTVLFTRT